jgi:hypothetical protein
MPKLHILTGPDKAQAFDLKDEPLFIGRSPHNDIQMSDITVSRRHLKIFRRRNKYFIKDLESENGTFVGGREIPSGIDYEIKEGVPIVVGMSLLCVGEGCLEYVMPFLTSIDLSKDIREDSGIFIQHKSMTTEKIIELVYKVTELLALNLDIDQVLEKILDYIFDFLRSIDRAAIILIDPKTGEFKKVASRLREPSEDTTTAYNREVVDKVIREAKALMVSNTHAQADQDLVGTLKLTKIESVMCVPMISGSKIRGVVYFDTIKEPYGFRKEDLALFSDLGKRTAFAIENALLHGDLEE